MQEESRQLLPDPSVENQPVLDVSFARANFAAFSEPSLARWGHFDNAGGSYVCRQVVERLTSYYTRTKVQPYQSYPASQDAGRAMDDSYARLAAYLGVDAAEVLFGPSTTQNIDVLVRALRAMWRQGDEIVVSAQDHEANAGPWRRLADDGIVVREWGVDRCSGLLDPTALDGLLGARTRLVALPHCSNIVGAVNPVAEITARVREYGALTVVDGVASAPHGLPDVGALGADVYLLSLYKTWGPHLGLFTVRRELLDALPNQSHFFNAEVRRKKLLPAGPDHGQIAAAAGVVDYLDALHTHHFTDEVEPRERGLRLAALMQAHEKKLLAPLLSWLDRRADVRVLGPVTTESRAPTVSFLPLERDPIEVHAVLTAHHLMAGLGHFYGVRPLAAMGVPADPGVVRLSFLHYTLESEIERLIEALAAALD